MKTKILFALLSLMPMAAPAAIPYRVEQTDYPAPQVISGNDSMALARENRFYIGGAYNFSMWDKFTDDKNVAINGKNTSSFDVTAGIRVYDTFRIEGNYIRTSGKWNAFELTGDTAMINAIFDARIDSMYRILRTQKLVPYVGFGAGLSWNTADNITIDDKISPVAAAMAGLGIELGTWFAIDLGYRYFYMFTPKFDGISDMAPTAHQFRTGIRISF